MSAYEHEFKACPVGMDDNADIALRIQERAKNMLGLTSRDPGVLDEAFRKKLIGPVSGVNVWPAAGYVEGLWPYSQDTAAADRLLIVRKENLYVCTPSANLTGTVTDAIDVALSDLTLVTNQSGATFAVGKRCRFVQMKNEVIIVQDGGILPMRYNGTSLFRAGIVAPIAPTDGGNVAGGVMVVGGIYQYWYTYVDELGRESSPGAIMTVTMGAGGGRRVNYVASTDAQVLNINIYRTANGQALGYRITQVANGTSFYNDTTVNDTNLVLLTQSPRVGQNDPPVAASLICKYKNRIVLNSTADREAIQVSDLNSPSQFAPIGNASFPTDGQTMRVTNEYGDEVTGFGSTGSGLMVFNRRSISLLLGSSPSTFAVIQTEEEGCTAPDSIQKCLGMTIYQSESGLRGASFSGGFRTVKLSGDMDTTFRSVSISYVPGGNSWPPTVTYYRNQRDQAAISWYMQNRYYLASPPFVYIYDLDTGGFCMDYMTNLPVGTGGTSYNGGGYLAACVYHIGRAYHTAFYAPLQNGGSGPLGEVWLGSYYPIVHTTGNGSFNFVWETRAIDGAGVPRNSIKELKRSTVFGTISAAPGGSGDPEGFALFSGTITGIAEDGIYSESYPFDNVSQVSTQFAGANFARDAQMGFLIEQEWTSKLQGRLLNIRIQGSATGRLRITGIENEYVRQTPS